MTLPQILILVIYFFVLSILAIYGWHRYYLVYLYMKNKGKQPPPGRSAALRRRCRGSPSSSRSTTRCTSPTA